MQKIIYLLLIISTITGCKTQSTTQSSSSKVEKQGTTKDIKSAPKNIEDPNKIWGNYILTQEDIKMLEAKSLYPATIQEIIAFSNESAWPLALQNLLKQEKPKNAFPPYNITFMAEIINENHLLIYKIPFAANTQMPDSLLLDKEDFYIILRK